MGATPTQPRKRFGRWNNQDSENNAMLLNHAYMAQQDGEVWAVANSSSGSRSSMIGYIDIDSDPVTGGTIAQQFNLGYVYLDDKFSFSFTVAKGEFFEITAVDATVNIYWRSHNGPIKKPIDYN